MKTLLCFFFIISIASSCTKSNVKPIPNKVVITFDDSPGFPENTEKILDVLEYYNAVATFFCVGKEIRLHQDLATRISKEHIMANHTYTHLALSETNLADTFEYEIKQTQDLIDSIQLANNRTLNRYFRAPYSAITEKQQESIISKGYKVTWWDISAEDWNPNLSVAYIYEYIFDELNQHSKIPIILFHLSDNTVTALELILQEFERRNIQVISLSEREELF